VDVHVASVNINHLLISTRHFAMAEGVALEGGVLQLNSILSWRIFPDAFGKWKKGH
jgi:hypothetical protein